MCRRENLKLFLKGERCYSDKCSFERRAYAPGQHGQNRFRKVSDYAVQLREKQKVKHMYGMLEGQFRRYFYIADQAKGVTGLNLLTMLERRFDNVVYRLGFAGSRDQARQFIRHNHFQIGGKKVNIPSCQVKPGDIITLKEKSRKKEISRARLRLCPIGMRLPCRFRNNLSSSCTPSKFKRSGIAWNRKFGKTIPFTRTGMNLLLRIDWR